MIKRFIRIMCDNFDCYNSFEIGSLDPITKTEELKIIKEKAKIHKYTWTRENKCYCKECALKLKLRNAKKKNE